jgi:hypothetical protein
MKRRRSKEREDKLVEQRKTPTEWIFVEKDYYFRKSILTSK